MKKIGLICATLLAGVSLSACGNSTSHSSSKQSNNSSQTVKQNKNHSVSSSKPANANSTSGNDYQQVSYNDLDSNSNDLLSKNITITGTVSKVHEEDGSYVLIVSMNNDQTENVMVAVNGSSVPKGRKISEGDQVTIKGTGGGKQSTPEELTDGRSIPYVDCEETVEFN